MKPAVFVVKVVRGLVYLASDYLTNFNANVRKQSRLQIINKAEAARRYPTGLPSPTTYRQKTMYTLPFEGEWLVAKGGPDEQTSHSWRLPEQHYAYDFVKVNPSGQTHRGLSGYAPNYYAFGASILAPAPGEVIEIREGIRDAFFPPMLDFLTPDMRGNYVVIQHSEGEYSLLAHLQRGSIQVEVGEHVTRGQAIARCGSSGLSTEPHLHFQVQDHPDLFQAVSLPIMFSAFSVRSNPDGKKSDQAFLVQGQVVIPDPPHSTRVSAFSTACSGLIGSPT